MTILDQLAEHARERVEADKKRITPDQMKALAGQITGSREELSFEKALKKE